MDIDFNAINEARRRVMGQQSSGAGIPGGMEASNMQMQSNPIAAMGATTEAPAPIGGMGTSMSDNPIAAAQNALPAEASSIIKTLTKMLDRIVPEPQQPQQ